uniref:Uncharacterized protein n=1 Tax=Lotus japonicus TaxID=34305 RepID=I3SCL0_LOTJA|nr:unknown [Lotus japonicus]
MEMFCGEKQYNYNTRLPTNSSKIELNLKVFPCGENTKERGLTRSSSLGAGERVKKISVPSLERSCSLPEYDKFKFLTNPTRYQKHEGPRHSAEEKLSLRKKMIQSFPGKQL